MYVIVIALFKSFLSNSVSVLSVCKYLFPFNHTLLVDNQRKPSELLSPSVREE